MHEGDPIREFWAKALVFALALAGCVVGAIPAVLLLGSLKWLPVYAAVATPIAVFALRGQHLAGRSFPSKPEVLLAAVGAIGPAASMSLATIGFFFLTRGLTSAVVWAAGVVGLEWTARPTIAWWVAVVAASLYGAVVAWLTPSRLWHHLFPSTAGIRTPYYRLLSQGPRRIAIVLLGVVIATVILFGVIGTEARLFYLWLCIVMAYCGSLLWQVGEEGSRPHRAKPIEHALARLLKAAGYDVVAQPRTGEASLDPFLMKTDFYAKRSPKGYLIELKVRNENSKPLDWTAAADLVSAAWALNEAKDQIGLGVTTVDPLLVVVGPRPSDSVASFSLNASLGIIHIENGDELLEAIQETDEGKLLELASRVLGSLARPSSEMKVEVGVHTAPALDVRTGSSKTQSAN